MKFNYIKFRNFQSYGNDLCTIQLTEKGIFFVTGDNKKDGGSNGAGKTSAILETITFALFGKTAKGMKVDEIINNQTKKDLYVELSFQIANDSFIIRRYRNHFQFDDKVIFEQNGKDISGQSSKETQKNIEERIKISFKSFLMSIVLSQEKLENFAEADATERRKIVENLLMYDFITRFHKASKEILRKIRPAIENLSYNLKEKKETVSTLTNNLLSYMETWENKIESYQSRIEDLKRDLKEWENLNPDNEIENRATIARKEEEARNLSKSLREKEKNLIYIKNERKTLEKKLRDKTKEIEDINENPSICPTCGGDIKDEIFEKYLKEREDEKQDLVNQIDSLKKNAVEIEKEFNSITKSKKEKIEEISILESSITDSLSDEDVRNIQNKITQANSEIKFLEEQINIDVESDKYVVDSTAQIEAHKVESKKIRSKLRRLEEELRNYEWWRDRLSNSPNSIKTFCINRVLKPLNKYINYYIQFFNYDMQYELDSELSDVIIKDGETTSFASLSGGEKRAVELSLVFSLYEIVKSRMPDNINIIILDELLSNRLDDVRISGVIEILEEFQKKNLTIFIIEHKNFIKENLQCRTINVIKDEDGLSSIELD